MQHSSTWHGFVENYRAEAHLPQWEVERLFSFRRKLDEAF